MAVAGKTEVNKVYDSACGSGSLLLKAAKIFGKEKCLRLEGSNFRLGGIALITRAVPSF